MPQGIHVRDNGLVGVSEHFGHISSLLSDAMVQDFENVQAGNVLS